MFWLDEAGLPMTGANIARAMQLSPPTVHEMVGRLVSDRAGRWVGWPGAPPRRGRGRARAPTCDLDGRPRPPARPRPSRGRRPPGGVASADAAGPAPGLDVVADRDDR